MVSFLGICRALSACGVDGIDGSSDGWCDMAGVKLCLEVAAVMTAVAALCLVPEFAQSSLSALSIFCLTRFPSCLCTAPAITNTSPYQRWYLAVRVLENAAPG